MTQFFHRHQKTWFNIDNSDDYHEKGLVKDTWKCQLCQYNGVVFKGVNTDMQRFKMFCGDCGNQGTMINFFFGEGSHARIVKYLEK